MAAKVRLIQGKGDWTAVPPTGASDADLSHIVNDFIEQGGVLRPEDGNALVEQSGTPGMSVQVAAGIIYVPNSAWVENSFEPRFYQVVRESSETGIPISSNSSGLTRVDLICQFVDKVTTPNDDADNVCPIEVVEGTPGSGAPSVPDDCELLAEVEVVDGETSITDSSITDRRRPILLNNSNDGWTKASDTFVYASASTFTIAGVDRTAIYTKGTRIKFTQSSTVKYAVVVGSAFSTDTTVTIAVNTDYTIANSAITLPYFSYQLSPQGYPGWFNYAVTFGGFSAPPTGGTKRFKIDGNTCSFTIFDLVNGTSNSTLFTITVPVAPTQLEEFAGPIFYNNNSSLVSTVGYISLLSGTTTVNLYTAWNAVGWAASNNKNCSIPITSFEF